MQSAGFWKQSWNTFKHICALPLIALVKFYQLCISPFTPPSCRFTPTCSQYALEALRKYKWLPGTIKTSDLSGSDCFFRQHTCPRRAEKPEEPAKGRHTVPPGRSRDQSHVPGQCSAEDSNSSVT